MSGNNPSNLFEACSNPFREPYQESSIRSIGLDLPRVVSIQYPAMPGVREDNKEEHSSNQSIKNKRLRAKDRSKMSRNRKKEYIKELEFKVRYLEKENIRLQNLLAQKAEEQDSLKQENVFEKEKNNGVRNLWKQVLDLESLNPKRTPTKFCEVWEKFFKIIFDKHKAFIDVAFRKLINDIHANVTPIHYRDLTVDYDRDYDIIKKFNNCTKFKESEFKKNHNLNEVDLFIASFKPSKKQFNFIKNVFIRKEAAVKEKCVKAIHRLIKTKQLIEDSFTELSFALNVLIKSGILSDEQLLNSKMKGTIFYDSNSFSKIWKVQSVPVTRSYNLLQDEIIGKEVKKHLRRSEHTFEANFNKFYIED
ncbi:unnamed protein product [Moneuplotes crassus]|uniref:BZIP domain-containing protein n=1 Tax=Euplotes crassus TaxID=5936 RepID=A0AAD1XIL7_EUPCR|nr:unnamed protein product [Moneuplotes crassus]